MSVVEHHNNTTNRSHKSKPRRDRHDETAAPRQNGGDAQQQQQRAPAVLSVERFAHRTGMTKGLLSYRERREKKRLETAKALRSYQKTMKRQGYEAGSGASRKRKQQDTTRTSSATNRATAPHQSDNDNGDDLKHGASSTEVSQENEPTEAASKTKKPRTNRFQKSIHESEQRQRQQQEFRQQAAERQNQKQQAVRRRRQRHKLLTARTSKGQPVMRNIVQDILTKLEAENGTASSRANDGQGK